MRNLETCCIRGDFTNFVKPCLRQILYHSGLLTNSANIKHEDINFFVQNIGINGNWRLKLSTCDWITPDGQPLWFCPAKWDKCCVCLLFGPEQVMHSRLSKLFHRKQLPAVALSDIIREVRVNQNRTTANWNSLETNTCFKANKSRRFWG